ncbi:hypothetical protein BV20DRAFT_427421 [Pilatotrama ljubarskyi]|nr:hypothetical protein BV20DRAFT_427421 [Pilatotrama ljubarskyi]
MRSNLTSKGKTTTSGDLLRAARSPLPPQFDGARTDSDRGSGPHNQLPMHRSQRGPVPALRIKRHTVLRRVGWRSL